MSTHDSGRGRKAGPTPELQSDFANRQSAGTAPQTWGANALSTQKSEVAFMVQGAGRPGQPNAGQRSIFGGDGPVFAQMPSYTPVTRGPAPQAPEPQQPPFTPLHRQPARTARPSKIHSPTSPFNPLRSQRPRRRRAIPSLKPRPRRAIRRPASSLSPIAAPISRGARRAFPRPSIPAPRPIPARAIRRPGLPGPVLSATSLSRRELRRRELPPSTAPERRTRAMPSPNSPSSLTASRIIGDASFGDASFEDASFLRAQFRRAPNSPFSHLEFESRRRLFRSAPACQPDHGFGLHRRGGAGLRDGLAGNSGQVPPSDPRRQLQAFDALYDQPPQIALGSTDLRAARRKTSSRASVSTPISSMRDRSLHPQARAPRWRTLRSRSAFMVGSASARRDRLWVGRLPSPISRAAAGSAAASSRLSSPPTPAPSKNFRTQPGGKEFPHKNKLIYDRLQNGDEPESERIVPRQEDVAVPALPAAPTETAGLPTPVATTDMVNRQNTGRSMAAAPMAVAAVDRIRPMAVRAA